MRCMDPVLFLFRRRSRCAKANDFSKSAEMSLPVDTNCYL